MVFFVISEHAWLNDCSLLPEETYENGGFYGEQLDLSSISFSSSFVCRDQDFSFGSVSPAPYGTQQLDDSPLFTCKSSFTSLQVEVTPTSIAYRDFSFQSHGESDGVEFFSPIPSMPSFTFFSTDSPAEPVKQAVFVPNISKFNAVETCNDFVLCQMPFRLIVHVSYLAFLISIGFMFH